MEKKTIPDFRDADGKLLDLKAKDFPKTIEGELAYCNYQIAKWSERKKQIESASTPMYKMRLRREKLLAQIAMLDEEIGADPKE